MRNEKKEKKSDIPRYCAECGKEIMLGEAYIWTQTKRGSEIYAHQKCLRRKNHESKSVDTGSKRSKGL